MSEFKYHNDIFDGKENESLSFFLILRINPNLKSENTILDLVLLPRVAEKGKALGTRRVAMLMPNPKNFPPIQPRLLVFPR